MLPKMGMILKQILAWMFQHKYTIIGEHLTFKYRVRKCSKTLNSIRRICKYNVELAVNALQQIKYIGSNNMKVVHIHLLGTQFNKICALDIYVNGCHFFYTTRHKFKTHSSCAGKEIHHCTIFIINIVVENIEQTFPRHISCRANGKVLWRIEATASETTSYYSHDNNTACL